MTDEKGRLRRFARDWVEGTGPQVMPARISQMAAPKYGSGPPPSALTAWLRVGVPFMLAGALLGVIGGLAGVAF